MWRFAFVMWLLGAQAYACGLALNLAIDVSLSVDEQEYRLQTGGIASALRDPSVIAAISAIDGGVAISVMQWSGRAEQSISLSWQHVSTPPEIITLARKIETIPRAFSSETAPGSALMAAITLHSQISCERHVTDVSGDGIANTGVDTRLARDQAVALGHTINGLAILGDDTRLEAFYRYNVIGGPGHFLEIARGFDDYGRAMRDKLLKELPQNLAMGPRQ